MLKTTLFAEAGRQLDICNSCRYCEGYCAVFVGLERRTAFEVSDVSHLANLCHDCRACLYACPYSPPHEFAVNPPRLFAELRRDIYDDCISLPFGLGRGVRGWRGAGLALALFSGVVVVIVAATTGVGALVASHALPASPYSVVPYPAILISMIVPFLISCVVLTLGASRYWKLTGNTLRGLRDAPAILRAGHSIATLEYLGGGGEPCHEDENPTRLRRIFHHSTSYGFTLCLLSTIAAAVLQDGAGHAPPYSLVSVPVLLGLVGGIGLVIGSGGLFVMKRSSDPAATDGAMAVRDYGFIAALFVLGATGLAVLCTRNTSIYGIVLVVHLATVGACFLIAPYTKFPHWIYRSLAIFQHHAESIPKTRSRTAVDDSGTREAATAPQA